jgi:integrase
MGKYLRRAPKYVQAFVDRHGKARFYFRRAGFAQVSLPGLPWSPQFMKAYEEALAGQPAPIGIARVKPGSIRALATSYFGSIAFGSMKSNSQYVRRKIIERFCEETDKDGNKFGDKSALTLQRSAVIKLMAARADKPESANGLRKALRAMMQHAVEIGLRADDPTRDVKALRPKSRLGLHRWTEVEIAQFEAKHPIGSKPRLAMALGLYTGQARQDVIAMGPQHIQDEVLSWIRRKTERSTGIQLAIPIHPHLRAIIDATPSHHLTFLVTEFGKPFAVAGFGNWFREQCDIADLRHCTFHGLRKAASVRLAEAGCSPHEIAAITGHASLKEIVRYTATADRKRLAQSAMEKVKAGTPIVKPAAGFDKKREKHEQSKPQSDGGSPGRIRTSDQPVNSRLLYR